MSKVELKIVGIFAGQGIQEVGMGLKLYRKSPLARSLYDTADVELGYKISEISFYGPKALLDKTIHTQPAILVFNHVNYELARTKRGFCVPPFFAGISSGEYNALLAAHAFSFEGSLKIIKARAEELQNACEINPGGLRAVIDTTQDIVDELHGLGLKTALINSPDQIVFGGRTDEIIKAEAYLREKNIRFVDPGVSGAFHTYLMEPAIDEFTKALDTVEIRDIETPVIANTTARPITKAWEIREELINQLTQPVLWQDSITYLAEQGIHGTSEAGKKRIATNLVKRIIVGGVIATVVTAAGIEVAVHWLRHTDRA
ncbi:ACP S-malonyltransferase [Patescibacteria group bacterium]|nr:ACP S-malonyltransferase [Patescibacteria group bacterium]